MFSRSFLVLFCLYVNKLNADETDIAPSLFINHGGGPYPILGQPDNLEIAESFRDVKNYVNLTQIKAIIVVTAHWEEDVVTISSKKNHGLYYDYYNFPEESYKYQYNALGNPELAIQIYESLKKEGIDSRLDSQRDWDHGVFIPMMLIRPESDIPIVPVSILKSQDAKQHYNLGKVLNQFRGHGFAIFGSGMSYHNMSAFAKAERDISNTVINVENNSFDNYLDEICLGNVEDRENGFLNWSRQPGALEAHPPKEADHLMPLIVNAGAGGSSPADKIFSSIFLKKFKLSGYIWRG